HFGLGIARVHLVERMGDVVVDPERDTGVTTAQRAERRVEPAPALVERDPQPGGVPLAKRGLVRVELDLFAPVAQQPLQTPLEAFGRFTREALAQRARPGAQAHRYTTRLRTLPSKRPTFRPTRRAQLPNCARVRNRGARRNRVRHSSSPRFHPEGGMPDAR